MRNDERADAIASDYQTASLSGRERALLDYATKLTTAPESVEEADVERLVSAGLTDAEILDTCQVAAYYNFVNRMASGLGVELEGYWEDGDSTPVRPGS